MFSAPGCNGVPNHAFSHPFVQVMISISPPDNNTPFTSNFPLSTLFSVPLRKRRTESVIYVLAKWELVSALCPSLHITFPHLCYFSCMHLNIPSPHTSSSHLSRLWECFWESCPVWWCSTFSFVMIGANLSPQWIRAKVSTPYFSSPLPFVTC